VARVSGPGEGYGRFSLIFVDVSSSLYPSPAAHLPMGVTLSLQERDLGKQISNFEFRLKARVLPLADT
jgi:hypothetical protein